MSIIANALRVAAFATALLATSSSMSAEFRGAMVHKTENSQQVVPDSYSRTQWVKVEFPIVAYDTAGLWDAGSQQFVIPEGVSFVRLSGQIVWSHSGKGARQVLITKNGALFDGYAAQNGNATFGTTPDQNVSTAILPVEPGDAFQLQAWQMQSEQGDPTSIYGRGGTWFAIEVIE